MKTHSKCLICNSRVIVDMVGYEDNHLCKCKSCGFVFAKVVPSKEELEKHYEGYGRNDYLSPITIKRYHELLDKMESFRKTNRILDVGCGIGYFLEVAKERGWEVYGTEFTDDAVHICEGKGINMKKGVLDPENYEPEFFDIITSFEVIEHINNPLDEIQRFNQLLRKGGLVYLTTPNFNSLLRYRLKGEYNIIAYPEHLSYFTPKTLSFLFKKNGFKIKKLLTTGISLTRLKTSKGKSDQAFISKDSDDEKLRNEFESNFLLKFIKNTINFFLSVIGKGDTLKAWIVKK